MDFLRVLAAFLPIRRGGLACVAQPEPDYSSHCGQDDRESSHCVLNYCLEPHSVDAFEYPHRLPHLDLPLNDDDQMAVVLGSDPKYIHKRGSDSHSGRMPVWQGHISPCPWSKFGRP